MALATCSRSVAVPRQSGSGEGSLPCRRVAARAAGFEEYVLDLQSSIKSEAERLEVGSGKAVAFQDDRCDPTPVQTPNGLGLAMDMSTYPSLNPFFH